MKSNEISILIEDKLDFNLDSVLCYPLNQTDNFLKESKHYKIVEIGLNYCSNQTLYFSNQLFFLAMVL